MSDDDIDPRFHLRWPVHTWPRVRVAGRFSLDDDQFAYRYFGQDFALHLYSYRGRMRLNDREFAFGPGDLTLTPYGVESRYSLPEPGFHYCIHFELEAPSPGVGVSADVDSIVMPTHHRLGVAREPAVSRIHAITQAQAIAGDDPVRTAGVSAMTQELLLWLATLVRDTSDSTLGAFDCPGGGGSLPEGPWLAAVEHAAAIVEHEMHQSLSVPQLAVRVGLSQNYLARRFRQRFGMTLPHYLLQRRLEQAKLLLTHTNLPINRIAKRVGMPDAGHFNKQFRRNLGLSPSAYRARDGHV